MMNVYENLKALNLALPAPPGKGGVYTPAKLMEDGMLYVSGCGPVLDEPIAGKLGAEFTVEDGIRFARNCVLNILAVVEAAIGDLTRIRDCVKLLVLVAGTDTFYAQPQVANGASGLLVSLFGAEAGTPARSAIGVNALPGNIPVEVEAIFRVGA